MLVYGTLVSLCLDIVDTVVVLYLSCCFHFLVFFFFFLLCYQTTSYGE